MIRWKLMADCLPLPLYGFTACPQNLKSGGFVMLMIGGLLCHP
jgi:hypothetical protein